MVVILPTLAGAAAGGGELGYTQIHGACCFLLNLVGDVSAFAGFTGPPTDSNGTAPASPNYPGHSADSAGTAPASANYIGHPASHAGAASLSAKFTENFTGTIGNFWPSPLPY